MHKEEIATLFATLGHPDRVKIVKLLYHNDQLTLPQLMERMNLEVNDLQLHLQALHTDHLISMDTQYCACNKEVIDRLMSFISTKCSCC